MQAAEALPSITAARRRSSAAKLDVEFTRVLCLLMDGRIRTQAV